MMRNTIEIKISGETIGFKTGPLAISIAVKESNCKSVNEFFNKLIEQDLTAVLALYYGSAKQYAIKKRITTDFNMADVSDWLEEMGQEQAQIVTQTLLQTFESKNSDTLTVEGTEKQP